MNQDKLNKWFKDSGWKKPADANDQIEILKETANDFKLRVKTKIIFEDPWYNVYAKLNRKK